VTRKVDFSSSMVRCRLPAKKNHRNRKTDIKKKGGGKEKIYFFYRGVSGRGAGKEMADCSPSYKSCRERDPFSFFKWNKSREGKSLQRDSFF